MKLLKYEKFVNLFNKTINSETTSINKIKDLVNEYHDRQSKCLVDQKNEYIQHKKNIGELLVKLKNLIQDKGLDWSSWLKQNIKIGRAIIEKYMRLAYRDDLEEYGNYGLNIIIAILDKMGDGINIEDWFKNNNIISFDNMIIRKDKKTKEKHDFYKRTARKLLGIVEKYERCENCYHKDNDDICLAIHKNSSELGIVLEGKGKVKARITNPEEFHCVGWKKFIENP